MQFLASAAAAALLSIPVILVLYILRVRRPEVRVASLMFWTPHVADRRSDTPWQRLRPSLLLLVQLLVAALLALALMRPGLRGRGRMAGTTVVMIDGSPSMTAADVSPNRFGVALSRARELSHQLGRNKEMAVILLGDHARLLAPPTSDPAVIAAALDRAQPSGQAANLSEGLSVANAVLAGQPGGTVILLSDGHAQLSATVNPPRLAARWLVERIGTSGDNDGIEAVGRTPTGQVFVQVANTGGNARDVTVEMRADGKLIDVVPVHIAAGGSSEFTWSGLPSGTTVLEARLTPGDLFALDDAAWLVTAAPLSHKVLLVTPGNGFLQQALRVRSDLDVTTVDPSQYRPGAYDLYLFDRFVPPGPLPSPAVVIDPPVGTGPVPAGAPVDPGGILPGDPRDPLLQYVSFGDVHVQVAATVTAPPDWHTVVAGANDPLVLVHLGEPHVAEITFDVHHSDLPLRAAFPILVQNLVSDLLPGTYENQVFGLSSSVPLVAEPGVSSLEVVGPDGQRQRLVLVMGTAVYSSTARPGVYTVTQSGPAGNRTARFVVQLTGPGQSQIAPHPPPPIQADVPPGGAGLRGTLEIWTWLATIAIVGLAVEWTVYLRG